jgi:fucose permease
MIMGVFGGGLFSFLMGYAADLFHGQRGAVYILLACMVYLFICALTIKEKKA